MRVAFPIPRYAKKRGHDSPAWRGGRTIMWPDQYVGVFAPEHPRANGSGYVREHILIAEMALGKQLPLGAVVHHADETQNNNQNGNLVICQDNSYHRLLHVRLRVLKAGGNPNLDKICGHCKKVVARSQFNKLRSAKDGLYFYCRECSTALSSASYSARRAS